MRVRAEDVLAPLGIRSRHLVALTVLRELGETTQQALATRLLLDSTNVVGLLNDLEGQGLVERRRSPEDRRRHTVVLTAAGKKRLGEAEQLISSAEDEVLAPLDADERALLYRLLQRAAIGEPDCAEDVAAAESEAGQPSC
jgi:DNA-binding MarR family transcriptional regulator